MISKRSMLDLVHSSINCDKSLGGRTVWRRNELAYTAHGSSLSPSSGRIKAGTMEELKENPEKIDAHWLVH